MTGIAERHRLHEQRPLERICGIRAGNCDSVRIEREIQLRVERVRASQRTAGDGVASARNQIGQIRPGVAGNVSVVGHNVDPVKLFHDGSLCPVTIEAHERAMEAGGRVMGCSGTREVDVALDVRAVRIDGVDIGHEIIRQLCLFAGCDLGTEVLDAVLGLHHIVAEEGIFLKSGLVLNNDGGNSHFFQCSHCVYEMLRQSAGISVKNNGLRGHFRHVINGTETGSHVHQLDIRLSLGGRIAQAGNPHAVELKGLAFFHHNGILSDQPGDSAVRL